MTDFDKVRAILDAATPGPLRASGATVWKPTGDGTDTDFTGFAVAWVALDTIDGTDAADARAIVVARNLAPEWNAVAEAARATSDELPELLDPENAPAAHGTWHPARRAMGEGSVELIDDDGCSLWVDPWEVAALVNGAVRSCAALDALYAKMKETLP